MPFGRPCSPGSTRVRVGVSLFTQNHGDWDRFEGRSDGVGPFATDPATYDDELALAEQIEPLGYDSIWAVEHHFSPLNLTPSPLLFLANLAGRTRRVDIGTMVIVLPWHDPLRVAEEIAMVDNLLQGRRLFVGLGRGAARREFDPRRIPMGESRARFLEGLEILRGALTEERFSYEGEHYSIAETSLRPRPRSADLTERFMVAGNSAETLEIAGREGLGLLLLNHKPWEDYGDEVGRYNAVRAQHGFPPGQPTVVVNAVCAATEDEAWSDLLRYFGEMKDGTNRHYEWDEPTHFLEATGYEHYAQAAERRLGSTPEQLARESALTQVWGTPEQCVERLRFIQRMTGAREFVIVFKYGTMPYAVAERSLQLFAEGALPALHAFDAAAARSTS
ncbi:MAG: LLM class flavin-dependent oxidoreductase [Chloroflexi bacterium]|nr:LLM class flavin-dependent oxidoreductase [Chloroflexota bacterium]